MPLLIIAVGMVDPSLPIRMTAVCAPVDPSEAVPTAPAPVPTVKQPQGTAPSTMVTQTIPVGVPPATEGCAAHPGAAP